MIQKFRIKTHIRIGGQKVDLDRHPLIHVPLNGLVDERVQVFAVTSGHTCRSDHIFKYEVPRGGCEKAGEKAGENAEIEIKL